MVDFWKPVVLTLTLLAQGVAELFVEDSAQCTLATPNLKFDKTRITAEVNLTKLNMFSGQKLRIGYVQVLQPFLYKGCYRGPFVGKQTHIEKREPGLCYSFCKGETRYVGLSLDTCLCIDTPVSRNQLKEDFCTSTTHTVSGGGGYISVYQIGEVNNADGEENSAKLCLAVAKTTPWLRWSLCSSQYRYMWENGVLVIANHLKETLLYIIRSDKNDSTIAYSNGHRGDWNIIMQLCAKQDTLPANVSSNRLPSGHSQYLWSGYIRSYHIVTQNDYPGTTGFLQGYIIIGDGIPEVTFSAPQNTLQALCYRDTPSSTVIPSSTLAGSSTITTAVSRTSSSTVRATSTFTQSSTVISTTALNGSHTLRPTSSLTISSTESSALALTSSPTVISTESLQISPTEKPTSLASSLSDRTTQSVTATPSYMPETSTGTPRASADTTVTIYMTENPRRRSQQNETENLVALYVVIPLVVVLAVLVVAVIIWRRRRHGDKREDSTTYHGVTNSKKGTRNAVTNASYQDDHIIKSQPADGIRHDYFTLEPVSDYAAIKDTDIDAPAGSQYDTARAVSTSDGRHDTGNVYNRLEDVTDDTYNQTNASSSRQDDTYNHIGNSGHDNTYNTTETLSNSKKNMHSTDSGNNVTGQVDDTYNHIGNNSNNVYNTAATLSNSTPGTRTTDSDYSKVNKRDDTYSHLDGTEQTLGANDDIDDTYNHIHKEMGDKKQVAAEYTYTKPIPKKPLPTPGQQKAPYDYATATPKGAGGTAQKPAMFSFDALPNDGSYELAKEPQQTLNYELAKPPGK